MYPRIIIPTMPPCAFREAIMKTSNIPEPIKELVRLLAEIAVKDYLEKHREGLLALDDKAENDNKRP